MSHFSVQYLPQYSPGRFQVNNLSGFTKEGDTSKRVQQEKKEIPLYTPSIKPLHIIIADDDEDDRELFTEALRDSDPNVLIETVKDGNSLLIRLLSADLKLPDLLFLDLNMPNKSGRECLDIIRKTERLNGLSVIIYSTSSSPKDVSDTYDKGANLYIAKPASFTDLRAMAKRILTLDLEGFKPYGLKRNFCIKL